MELSNEFSGGGNERDDGGTELHKNIPRLIRTQLRRVNVRNLKPPQSIDESEFYSSLLERTCTDIENFFITLPSTVQKVEREDVTKGDLLVLSRSVETLCNARSISTLGSENESNSQWKFKLYNRIRRLLHDKAADIATAEKAYFERICADVEIVSMKRSYNDENCNNRSNSAVEIGLNDEGNRTAAEMTLDSGKGTEVFPSSVDELSEYDRYLALMAHSHQIDRSALAEIIDSQQWKLSMDVVETVFSEWLAAAQKLQTVTFYLNYSCHSRTTLQEDAIRIYAHIVFGTFKQIIWRAILSYLHALRIMIYESAPKSSTDEFVESIIKPILSSQLFGNIIREASSFIRKILRASRVFIHEVYELEKTKMSGARFLHRMDTLINREDHLWQIVASLMSCSTEGCKYLILDQYLRDKTRFFSDIDTSIKEEDYSAVKRIYDHFEELLHLLQNNHLWLASETFDNFYNEFALHIGNNLKAEVQRIFSECDRSHFVSKLVSLLRKCHQLEKDIFRSNKDIIEHNKHAFEIAVQSGGKQYPEILAETLDKVFKSANLEYNGFILDRDISWLPFLLTALKSSKAFLIEYKQHLMNRLLLNKSSDLGYEKSVVHVFSDVFGSVNVNEVRGVLKDIEKSKENMKIFKEIESYGKRLSKRRKLDVTILSQNFWPAYQETPVKLPSSLRKDLEVFTDFYDSKFKYRKIQWRHQLSHCVLTVRLSPTDRKELILTLFQALILLQFNEHDEASTAEMQEKTGLPLHHIVYETRPLTLGRSNILILQQHRHETDNLHQLISQKQYPRKSEKRKSRQEVEGAVEDSFQIYSQASFKLNVHFESKHYRVKINHIRHKKGQERHETDSAELKVERPMLLQCALVRIMKQSRMLSRHELFNRVKAEVDDQLQTFPAIDELSMHLEKLIDKDYIVPADDDSGMLTYVP